MEALVYFVIWGVFIFLMMRMGCGSHVMGHSHRHGGAGEEKGQDAERRQDLKWYPPAEDIDPVCKKQVRTADAKPSVYEGYVYYFCSRECRELFSCSPITPCTGSGSPCCRALPGSLGRASSWASSRALHTGGTSRWCSGRYTTSSPRGKVKTSPERCLSCKYSFGVSHDSAAHVP